MVPIFYPDQDLRYKNKRPKTLEIMKQIFGIFKPIIVLQDEDDILVDFLKNENIQRLDTSFIVLDKRILSIQESEALLVNANLYNLERLGKHIIWINGPLGLGDETFHLTEAQYFLPSSQLPGSIAFKEIQEAREKHRTALDELIKLIDWNSLLK